MTEKNTPTLMNLPPYIFRMAEAEKNTPALMTFPPDIFRMAEAEKTTPTLTTLPPEMIAEITSHLPAMSIAKMRLVSRSLNALTRPAPRLSRRSWCLFHKGFEASARRTSAKKGRGPPMKLACTGCMQLLGPDCFQDSQAKRRCDRLGGRLCLHCAATEGEYNVRSFRYQKRVCFSCFACSETKKTEEEARYTERVPGLPLHGTRHQADKGNKRWCKDCWKVATMYVNARMV